MSERLVNIELPWQVPECTYRQRIWMAVAAAVSWSLMVLDGSSFSMWAKVDEGTQTMPTQANNKARSYTRLVCKNHGPWWHDPLNNALELEVQNTSSFAHASKC
jgi:hypothetical protein